jgi:hypothetical protein
MSAFTRAILTLPLLWSMAVATSAAPAGSCKECGDQRRRCMANYPGPTCKTEYVICMKGCRK